MGKPIRIDNKSDTNELSRFRRIKNTRKLNPTEPEAYIKTGIR